MKKTLITLLAMGMAGLSASAQHFYRSIDVSTGNLYSFVVANLASAGINYLTDNMLVDNYYSYTTSTIDVAGAPDAKVKNYSITGVTARDAFNDITAGGRLGYQSYNPSTFNWCVYGSAHYKLNQFKTQLSSADLLARHRVQQVKVGGGFMVSIGDFESHTRVLIDAGVRYNIPIGYKGVCGDDAGDVINSGLSSRYSVRFGGTSWLQGIGVWAEVPHYNLFKSGGAYMPSPKVKMYSFGLVYSISPWKTKEAYDK